MLHAEELKIMTDKAVEKQLEETLKNVEALIKQRSEGPNPSYSTSVKIPETVWEKVEEELKKAGYKISGYCIGDRSVYLKVSWGE